MQATSKTAVVLGGPKDWEEWLEIIKTAAMKAKVWKFVDPNTPRGVRLIEPLKPTPESVRELMTPTPTESSRTADDQGESLTPQSAAVLFSALNEDEKELYRTMMTEFQYERKQYEKQEDALQELRAKIQESISRDFLRYTFDCDTPYDMLIKLKQRFAPTDRARELDMIETWKGLQKVPKGMDYDAWLMKWESAYEQCRQLGIPDVEGNRPIYDFLGAISSLSPNFADMWDMKLLDEEASYDFLEVIKKYRDYRRATKHRQKPRGTHGAFPVSQTDRTKDNEELAGFPATLQGRNQQGQRRCLCESYHEFSNCPYILESQRPAGWKANENIEKAIKEKIKKHPPYEGAIRRARKKERERLKAEKERTKDETEPSAFIVDTTAFQVSSSIGPTSYPLATSTILDSGATVHICNDRTRFTNFRNASPNDNVYAGDSIIPIEGFGTVEISVKCPRIPTGVRKISLLNTALVPGFHTNVASLQRFIAGGLHWDTKHEELTYEGKTYCLTPKVHGQWVLEYNHPDEKAVFNTVFAAQSSYEERRPLKGTLKEWHCRMGHLNIGGLEHLEENTSGVKITDKSYDNACEICRVSYATKLPSRARTQIATEPNTKLHADLISNKEGFSGETQVLHLLCDRTKMHYVYVLPNKRQDTLVNTIQDHVQYLRTKWDCVVRTIRIDGERSLGNDFEAWVLDKGITVEESAPYTSEQNGAAERSGRTIIQRATALRLSSGLPEDLWPEFFKTAGYLLNRTPTRSLNWETPYGCMQRLLNIETSKPKLSHIRIYGCRAYAFIQNRPKLDRINPRAYIGYLVGYDSTNIFRIWVPSLGKILRTRDVTFDESKSYDPSTKEVSNQEAINLVEIPEVLQPFREDDQEEDPELAAQKLEEAVRAQEARNMLLRSTSREEEQGSEESQPEFRDSNVPTPLEPVTQPVREKEAFPNDLRQEPTPELTPTPEPQTSIIEEHRSAIDLPHPEPDTVDVVRENSVGARPRIAPRDINASLDTSNIVEGKRKRIPSRRYAYVTALNECNTLNAFYAAFQAGTSINKERIHRTNLPAPPISWKQLQTHPCKIGFKLAAEKEYGDLVKRGTFKSVREEDVDPNLVIPLMWVFTYKFDNDGYLLKYKARLVVRGDLQKVSTYEDTYAATLASRVVRALMAMAAYFDLDTLQLDAVNAFTNSFIDEDVFVRCPNGFEEAGICLKLVRALYGLKRSPLLWFEDFTRTLQSLGLVRVPEAQCLFVSPHLILFFFVDDVCIFSHPSSKKEVDEFVSRLLAAYEFRVLGEVKWFLGIRIVRDRTNRKLWLCQDSYIDKLSESFSVKTTTWPKTPMGTEDLESYDGTATAQEIHSYQRKVGSINYIAVATRPDVARTAQKLSEFLINPGPQHQKAADRAIAYLISTRTLALEYGRGEKEAVFQASSDASFADNIDTRTSTEGYLFSLFGGMIDWRSTKQKTVTTSTTEAELLSLSHAAKQLYWWQRFFKEIKLDLDEDYTLNCDNLQTVRLMLKESPKLITKLKHVDIHQHWVRQEVEHSRLNIKWISTTEMPADGFTKALPRQRHEDFVRKLRLVDIGSMLPKS